MNVKEKRILVFRCSGMVLLLQVNLNHRHFEYFGIDMYECDFSTYACLVLWYVNIIFTNYF
jgi:hypothetical protein